MKPTPGPWSVREISDRVYVALDSDMAMLAEVLPTPTHDRRRANARLMAAAPELLQAVQELLLTVTHLTSEADHWQEQLKPYYTLVQRIEERAEHG